MAAVAEHIDGEPTTYTDDDLPGIRVRVTDGEGHEHWAGLTGESVRNMRAVVKARRDHPYETVTVELPKPKKTEA